MLEQTFLLRVLPPFEANLKKRLIRSPKIYLRDSGLLHALLDLPSAEALLGHPVFGASWEGFVLENVFAMLGRGWRAGFYRTASGAELDLVLERGSKRIAVECKATSKPWVLFVSEHTAEAYSRVAGYGMLSERAQKCLATLGTCELATRLVVLDTVLVALHETAWPLFLILVEECPAASAVHLEREDTWLTFRHDAPP